MKTTNATKISISIVSLFNSFSTGIFLSSALLFVFVSLPYSAVQADSSASTYPRFSRSLDKVIRVGVRKDAIPFSYKKPTKNEDDMLVGYGGYIVEVCKSVLRQIVGTGAFSNFHVKAVEIESGNRFENLLSEEVDMLCGPDSITTSRLKKFNVSHPIFLSGIAIVRWPDFELPRTKHCGPILGVVKGTTSQLAGVSAALAANAFDIRFDRPVRRYLELSESKYSALHVETLADTFASFTEEIFNNNVTLANMNGFNAISPPESVVTEECPNGFKSGPVVVYKNHDLGIKDLCDKKIYFYLGDVDIVKKKMPMGCDAIISRRTYTKEAYGVYFRKPLAALDGHDDPLDMRDAVLYTEFNNALLLQMQESQNLLMNQYITEFGDSKMASDLEIFFESFQFATNH